MLESIFNPKNWSNKMSTTETQKLANGWKLIKMVEEIQAAGKAFDITLGNFKVSYKNGLVAIEENALDADASIDTTQSLEAWFIFAQNYPMDNYTMTKLRNTVNLLAALS